MSRSLGCFVALLVQGCALPPPPDTSQPAGTAAFEAPQATVRRDEQGELLIRNADARGAWSEVPVFDARGGFNPEAATLSNITVAPREDRAFVVQSFPTATGVELAGAAPSLPLDPFRVRTLYALEGGGARIVTRLDDETPTAIVFVDDGVVVASCSPTGSAGRLRRFDREARTLQREVRIDFCPRLESPPTGVGAIHFIEHRWADARTLATVSTADSTSVGSVLEEIPLGTRDAVVRLVAEDIFWDEPTNLRVELLELAGGSVTQLPRLAPSRVWRFSTATGTDLLRWRFALSPDDRWLFVPGSPPQVIDLRAGVPRPLPTGADSLFQVGVADGAVPVHFTPDGRGVLAHRLANYRTRSASLVFFSLDTFETRALPVTLPGAPRVAFSPVAPWSLLLAGRDAVALWRLDTERGEARRAMTFGPTPPVFAQSAARGGEAWIVRDGLVRRSLPTLAETSAAIDWVPTRVAALVGADAVLVDRPRGNALVRIRGDTAQTEFEIPLPVPARR
jgi:hypothetical protein